MRTCSFLIVAMLGAACASPRPHDPVTTDPASVDPTHPAALAEATFESAGSSLNGIVYLAQGAGPHPTAILLHGLPGYERNLDLAQAIRRAGFNVVFFHYRGAWGSGGDFAFDHALQDVAATIDQVRDPGFAATHRVDPERIALVGHSMGGFLALTVASDEPAVRCVASLAGANLGAAGQGASPEQAAAFARQIDGWTGPLAGTSGAALVREVTQNAERYDTIRRVSAFAGRPVLLVAGTRDRTTPVAVAHDPLVRAFEEAGATQLTQVVLDTDHAFSSHRIALARAVVDWLTTACR
ncbi:MAG: alpha/beta fold hydrolase [Myxococcales bacterium]|nr:alpha/beta fold hydrolase [Myxococcales bacterium]